MIFLLKYFNKPKNAGLKLKKCDFNKARTVGHPTQYA